MSRRGWALFLAMSLIWGVPYLLIKVADDGGVPVPVLVFTRVAVGAALLLPVAARRRGLAGLRARWRWVLAFACVEMVLPWMLLTDAERRLSSSLSGLLIAAVPIIAVMLARLTGGGERLTALRWAGLLAGLAGVGLLAGPAALRGGAWPIAEVMLVAVGYATGPLVVSRRLGDLPGLAVTAVCLSFAAVVYAPFAAWSWPAAMPSPAVLAALAGLGVICTALAFVLFFKLIAEVGPARATVITYLNPAVAVALGVTVLGEPLTARIVAAFALILAGSVLATRAHPPRPAGFPGHEAAGRRRGALRRAGGRRLAGAPARAHGRGQPPAAPGLPRARPDHDRGGASARGTGPLA